MIDNKDLIDGLNDLLAKSIDAEKGYMKVSEPIKNASVKLFFERKSRQRGYFAHELRNEIIRLGGEVDSNEGSIAGDLHRFWIDVKTFITSDDVESALELCETGEKAALKVYDDFIGAHKIPEPTLGMIENQRNNIALSLKTVSMLEDVVG